MKHKVRGQIEPLESRIAPATLISVGQLGVAGTTDYNGANAGAPASPLFYHTTDANGSVVTTAVGGDANTYYIKLKAGDEIDQYGNGGFSPLIAVSKGTVVAFFVDSTTTGVLGQVDPGELSGISLGTGAAFKLNKDLDGSILTNYNDKTNTIVMDNLLGPKQSIAGIETGGSVSGGIYGGGNITKVTVNGSVTSILTGSAANGVSFDLLRGSGNGGAGVLSITPATGEVGGSISTVEVRSIDSLFAGSGGVGGKGGFVKDVQIFSDDDTITIKGGDGGASVGGKAGGIGGDVSAVFISGVSDLTPDHVQILAGAGGSAVTNTGGKGGDGGKILNVYVGYDSVLGKPVASKGLLSNIVDIGAGAGGSAKVGGKGGTLTSVKVLTQTQDLAGNPYSIAPYEISVHGGNGGAPNDSSGGNGGLGGKVDSVEVVDQDSDVTTAANILVTAGNGGQTVAPNVKAKGADGGSLSNVSVLAFRADIFAGDGSSGTTGGKGGALTSTTFIAQDLILPNVINVAAGTGGDGYAGNAGKGGDLKTLKVVDSNLAALNVNAPGTFGGNGGTSTNGKGGDGGVVSGLDIIDSENGVGVPFSGQFVLRSGIGGDGGKGGGKGGDVSSLTFFAEDVGVDFAAGAGGNATVAGAGGAGGKMTALNATAVGLDQDVQVNGTIKSGQGGIGLGSGKGGAGGDISIVNLNVAGNVQVMASNGGTAEASAAGGQGGSLIGVGAFARDGFGVLIAGNAGIGGKAAKGGSIAGTKTQLVGLRTSTDLTIEAGNGSTGGDGGSVTGVAFGSSFDNLSPTPTGDIVVKAGDGGTSSTIGGKGGSIATVSGNPGSGAGTTTTFTAGTGAAGTSKAGDGGSISDVLLSGVGDDFIDRNNVEIVVQAGDAGAATTATTGAKGGQIKNISVNDLDPDTVFKSVIAGNGGAADPTRGKGGDGGTIDGVRVIGGTDLITGAILSADIGYRSGKEFGVDSMGGLFAGVAGTGGGKAGLAGSVRNISADSIAAIVAGRDAAPQEAEVVEKISLNDLTALQAGKNSPFTITYTGGGTTAVIALTDPLVVQNAIDTLASPPAPDNVKVTRTATSTFVITNTVNGNIDQYTAEENINREVIEEVSGEHSVLVKTNLQGTATNPELDTFTPENSGTYAVTYNGASSSFIAYNSTSAQLQTELNTNVPSIVAAGGVVVTGDNVNGFKIRFNQNGDRTPLTVTADVAEVQRIDTLGVGQFQIDVGNGNVTTRLDSHASNMQVMDAINMALNGPTVTVASDPKDSTAYIVTFDQTGQQANFVVTEFAPLIATTIMDGTANTPEVQSLSFQPRATFSAKDYAAANIVGAIVDPNEIGSPIFKFTPVGPNHAVFKLGDQPIDGLIVAKKLDQTTLNFTPEASLVGGVFFDNDNKI